MKLILISLIAAVCIAALHVRFIYAAQATRYPLLAMVATGLASFALWAVWEGFSFVAVAMLLFLVNSIGLLLVVEKGVAEVVLWRSNRVAAQNGGGDEHDR